MAVTTNRWALPVPAWSLSGVWIAACLAMVGLSACTFFLLPEESFAIAAGLLVLLVAAGDLRSGFLAFVVIYPFLPSTWGVDIAAWMPYLTAKRLCCLALAFIFLLRCKGTWDTPRVRLIGWAMVALVVVQMVAGFGSRDPLGAVKRTFGDAVEWYFPFMMAAHLFRTRAQIGRLLTFALVSMGVAALLAIIEHAIDYNFYDSFVAAREDIQFVLTEWTETHRSGTMLRRSRVAFKHPIELGLHLMIVVLALAFFLRRRGLIARLGLLIGLPLYLLALLHTYSRGPLLGLICGVVWFGLIGRGTRVLLPVILVGGIGAYLLMPTGARDVLSQTIATSTDIQTGNSMGGGTVRSRLNLLQVGLQYSRQNLWFGLGPAELRDTKVSAGSGKKEVVDFTSIDNFYLQVLLRHGLVTLVMTAILYIYMAGMFTRGAFTLTDRDAARLAAIAAAVCVANYVALGTVGHNITLFWILLGPIARACDLYQSTARTRKRENQGGGRQAFPRKGWAPPVSGDARREEEAAPVPVSACRARVPALASVGAVSLVLLLAPRVEAAPSFFGTSGLFMTPTGQAAPRGAWTAGANYVSRDFRPGAASYAEGTVTHSLALTLLPRVEVAAVLNNWEGKLGVQRNDAGPSADMPLAGYNTDRSVAVHWLAIQGRNGRPGVALGMRDAFGTVQPLRAQYAVATWSLNRGSKNQPLNLSAGVGTKSMRGPFGGIEWQMDRRATMIVETVRGQVHGGFRLVPLRNFQIDAAAMGLRSLGGGLSYQRKF